MNQDVISKAPCPRCLASAGEVCRTTFSRDGSQPGKPVRGYHIDRLGELHRISVRTKTTFFDAGMTTAAGSVGGAGVETDASAVGAAVVVLAPKRVEGE